VLLKLAVLSFKLVGSGIDSITESDIVCNSSRFFVTIEYVLLD